MPIWKQKKIFEEVKVQMYTFLVSCVLLCNLEILGLQKIDERKQDLVSVWKGK